MKGITILGDDGEYVPDNVHVWALGKYQLLKHYADMFSTGMKGKWNCRVYVDLFAGAGRAKIIETREIVGASPTIALSVPYRFDKYIFCEADGRSANALRARIARDYADIDALLFHGDANKSVLKVISAIPKSTRAFRVLVFCFVDPYKSKNLKFSTIKSLAEEHRVDFLILLPSYMDINRAKYQYIKEEDTTLEVSLGDRGWRKAWEAYPKKRGAFGRFYTEMYCKQMEKLGYINPGNQRTIRVRRSDSNTSLYDLAFFSRHPTGLKFWEETMLGVDGQGRLFDFFEG